MLERFIIGLDKCIFEGSIDTKSVFFFCRVLYLRLRRGHHIIYELALGPRLRPKVATTLTNLLLYWILLLQRPVFFFFFSPASTLGVWPRTLPARAREPWTWKRVTC